MSIYKKNKFTYTKKYKPASFKNSKTKKTSSKERIQLYTENWDDIRKKVYSRDGYRCVYCGKKGLLHAHHIIPVRISHDNSMSNLVSLCNKCHKKLEMIGFTILEHGGGRAEVRKTELGMIMEAKKERYIKKNKI